MCIDHGISKVSVDTLINPEHERYYRGYILYATVSEKLHFPLCNFGLFIDKLVVDDDRPLADRHGMGDKLIT